jgi:peptide/nickel transport system substrate-binding protein
MLPPRERARPLLASAVTLSLVILAVSPSVISAQAPAAPARREIRIGVPGLPAAIDPLFAVDSASALVARQVFDTLVAYREGSTDIEPGLATRWAVSRDGRVWSFTLRDNVRFHDGTALTAGEVAASFARHLDPQHAIATVWPTVLRGRPGVVKEVRAANARTVEFVLVQPYAPLLTVLAHPGFGVARSVGAADGHAVLVGTGPFRVVDVASGRLALEAVAGYWGGASRTERLVFLDVPTDDVAEADLDARSLDVWFPSGPPRRADGSLSVPGLRMGYLALQTEKEPFSRKKIRQAVAAALDPGLMAQALDRAAIPLQSFLPPGAWGRREGSPLLGGTRELVKKLLAEGGWAKGFTPTMLVAAEEAGGDLRKLAESMQRMLGAADVPVILRVESTATARAVLQSGEYDMALTETQVSGGDPHLLLFPLSTSETASRGPRALNFSFYRNPRLDDVLIRASQLSFRPERQKLYGRAQATLADELPWIPIYVRLVWAVARPEVRGLRLHPTGFHRLDGLFLEAARASR